MLGLIRRKAVVYTVLSGLVFIASLSLSVPSLAIPYKFCKGVQYVKNKTYIAMHPRKEPVYPGIGQADNEPLRLASLERQGPAERIPVLMYHFITPKAYNKEPGNKSVINLESFEKGMAYLYEQDYYTASLRELEAYIHGQIELPRNTVVITFDDGYENNLIYAYPILKQYGFRATLFPVGSKIQQQTSALFKTDRNSYVSWEQIEASRDVFEYHSHTYDLHRKTVQACSDRKSAVLDPSMLSGDITRMKELGIDSPYFAYPFGEVNYRAIHSLNEHGYRMAFTVYQGFVRPGDPPMKLKRLTVLSDTDMALLLKTGKYRTWLLTEEEIG